MANSEKPEVTEADTQDAAVPEATAPDAETATPDAPEATLPPEDQTDPATDPAEHTDPEDESPLEAHTPEPEEPTMATEPTPDPTQPTPRRRGGFLATVLGGVAAAAIGAGATLYLLPEGWQASNSTATKDLSTALDTQAAQLARLGTELEQLSGRVDAPNSTTETTLQELQQALERQTQALQADITAMGGQVETLATRLSDLEKRPLSGSGTVAIDAYERELEALKQALETQRNANASMAEDVAGAAQAAEDRIAAAAAQARKIETSAALMRLKAALETGGGYRGALDDLGIEAPAALRNHAEQGVATPAELKTAFVPAARTALNAALKESAGPEAQDRMGAFLRSQLGLRSLAPREGGDPDAILSRAEAALAGGDIATALAEIATLPPGGQSAMAGWVQAAQARADALAAADTLAQSLATN